MAIKLYPPQIEGVLPAFYKNYENNELVSATIEIPFGMNRAVAATEFNHMALRIKTVSTNTEILSVTTKTDGCGIVNKEENIVSFNLTKDQASLINEGQYYKAQLAFISEDNSNNDYVIGYYSTVGIIKCVAKPTVSIAGFQTYQTNNFKQVFVGQYEQNTEFGDSTEKVETYSFNIWNANDILILSSGELLHNTTNDISSYQSQDLYTTNRLIKSGELYYVQYTVTTLNKLTISSPKYKIMASDGIDISFPLALHGSMNYDNGYVELYLADKNYENGSASTETICSGMFMISRGSESDDYFEWQQIVNFNIDNDYPSNYTFRDYTIEQGITYKYRLQQYNINSLYSNPIEITYSVQDEQQGLGIRLQPCTIYADFEDMFLYDGERQLKVRFNPKVNSFKNTVPEQKIETIGSKFPFIFRNGHVCYKEFPISGLISFQMDEAMLFLNDVEINEAKILEPIQLRTSTGYQILNVNGHDTNQNSTFVNDEWISGTSQNTTFTAIRQSKNLTSDNMMGERYFKLKVLDWLTDGNVKLFRSPAEGNYLVRLLNVSMTPQDPLGRMIHTFTCTAYEIAELTYDNLLYYNIVSKNNISLAVKQWSSIKLNDILNEPDSNGFYEIPLNGLVSDFNCIDFAPNDIIAIHFLNSLPGVYEYITIGVTGAYNYSYDDRSIDELLIKPSLIYPNEFSRIINIGTEGLSKNDFDNIENISTQTYVAQQIVGPVDNLLTPQFLGDSAEELKQNLKTGYMNYYLIEENDNYIYKYQLLNIEILHARLRNLIPIYQAILEDNTECYALTPFGQPYINSRDIVNIDGVFIYVSPTANLPVSFNIKDMEQLSRNSFEAFVEGYDIYAIYVYNNGKWVLRENNSFYDTFSNTYYNDYDPTFSINSDNTIDSFIHTNFAVVTENDLSNMNNIDLTEIQEITLTNCGLIEELRIGNGVMLELTEQVKIIDYTIETEQPILYNAKQLYLTALNNYSSSDIENKSALDLYYDEIKVMEENEAICDAAKAEKERLEAEHENLQIEINRIDEVIQNNNNTDVSALKLKIFNTQNQTIYNTINSGIWQKLKNIFIFDIFGNAQSIIPSILNNNDTVTDIVTNNSLLNNILIDHNVNRTLSKTILDRIADVDVIIKDPGFLHTLGRILFKIFGNQQNFSFQNDVALFGNAITLDYLLSQRPLSLVPDDNNNLIYADEDIDNSYSFNLQNTYFSIHDYIAAIQSDIDIIKRIIGNQSQTGRQLQNTLLELIIPVAQQIYIILHRGGMMNNEQFDYLELYNDLLPIINAQFNPLNLYIDNLYLSLDELVTDEDLSKSLADISIIPVPEQNGIYYDDNSIWDGNIIYLGSLNKTKDDIELALAEYYSLWDKWMAQALPYSYYSKKIEQVEFLHNILQNVQNNITIKQNNINNWNRIKQNTQNLYNTADDTVSDEQKTEWLNLINALEYKISLEDIMLEKYQEAYTSYLTNNISYGELKFIIGYTDDASENDDNLYYSTYVELIRAKQPYESAYMLINEERLEKWNIVNNIYNRFNYELNSLKQLIKIQNAYSSISNYNILDDEQQQQTQVFICQMGLQPLLQTYDLVESYLDSDMLISSVDIETNISSLLELCESYKQQIDDMFNELLILKGTLISTNEIDDNLEKLKSYYEDQAAILEKAIIVQDLIITLHETDETIEEVNLNDLREALYSALVSYLKILQSSYKELVEGRQIT